MNNKEFTFKLIDLCSELLDTAYQIKQRKKQFKHMFPIFDKIGKLLEKRFNIEFEIKKGFLLSTLPPINTIGSSVTNIDVKKSLQIVSDKFLKNLVKHNDKIFKVDKGFYIDRYNLKIIYKGNTKLKAIIFIDPIKMYDIGLSAEELAAAILHEVGHDFEYINYTIFLSRKSEHIVEQILDSINKDNFLDRLVEIVVKESGETTDIKELDLKDKIIILFEAPVKIFNYNINKYIERLNLSQNPGTDKEFEIIADRFVSNFNLEASLSSGLTKMKMYLNSINVSWEHISGEVIYKTLLLRIEELFMSSTGIILATIISALVYAYIYMPLFTTTYGKLSTRQKETLSKIIEFIDRIFLLRAYMLFLVRLPILLTSPLYMIGLLGLNGLITARNYIINYSENLTINKHPYERFDLRLESIKRNLIEELKNIEDPELKRLILEKINDVEKDIIEVKRHFKVIKDISFISEILPLPTINDDPNALNPVYLLSNIVKEHMNNDLYIHTARLEFVNRNNG